jgi:hypothetical protein
MSSNAESHQKPSPSIGVLTMKYIFRSIHMASFALIFGNMTMDYYFGNRVIQKINKKEYLIFHICSSIMLIISGLINMIILVKENKYIKNLSYKIWKNLLIGKFILSIFLTPVLDAIMTKILVGMNAGDKTMTLFRTRFALVVVLFVLSPFIRYFREYFLVSSNISPAGVASIKAD